MRPSTGFARRPAIPVLAASRDRSYHREMAADRAALLSEMTRFMTSCAALRGRLQTVLTHEERVRVLHELEAGEARLAGLEARLAAIGPPPSQRARLLARLTPWKRPRPAPLPAELDERRRVAAELSSRNVWDPGGGV
jgi:hypothetical protein